MHHEQKVKIGQPHYLNFLHMHFQSDLHAVAKAIYFSELSILPGEKVNPEYLCN